MFHHSNCERSELSSFTSNLFASTKPKEILDRIELPTFDQIPDAEDVALRVGTTASVLVMTGTSGKKS